jgi:winged helix DNA-binding protein
MSERHELLTRRRLNRATLARQMLLQREGGSALEAVERLCGMQAQEPRPPFPGLWTRLQAFRGVDLHRALHDRTIVRGTLMRGTLHLMSAADYVAHRTTLQPMLTRSLALLGPRAEGLAAEQVLPVARALLGERPRTFGELRAALVEAFPGINDRALGFTVRMSLPLVMIPTEDRWGFPANARFGLAESWLGTPISDKADPEGLILRYLAAFGPATAADVQQWSGLQGIKPVLESLRPRLSLFRDERGRTLFDLPDAARPAEETPAPPRFLPEFDNLLLSHADRTRVLADEHRHFILGAKNGRIPATFLVDGWVAGIWRVERKKHVATLAMTPFAPLPKDAAVALAEVGEALLRFLEEDAVSFDLRHNPPLNTS